MKKWYKLIFFVPINDLEQVKSALFAAGAGVAGHYEQCCWQTLGQGQFCPTRGANPAIGAIGRLEKVQEYRVEMVCAGSHIKGAIAALKLAHPYEEPAFDVFELIHI